MRVRIEKAEAEVKRLQAELKDAITARDANAHASILLRRLVRMVEEITPRTTEGGDKP